MSDETAKCAKMRQERGDFDVFLRGSGIDLGCGKDLLVAPNATVQPYDKQHGDAQYLNNVPDNSKDFVYSSHCLEHMVDLSVSLANWCRVLKPGGHMYTVIPDFILYEKMRWPSRFNPDHKHSFSLWLTRGQVKRQNHWHIEDDLLPVMEDLGITIMRFELEDVGFDYNKGPEVDQTFSSNALCQICIVGRKNG